MTFPELVANLGACLGDQDSVFCSHPLEQIRFFNLLQQIENEENDFGDREDFIADALREATTNRGALLQVERNLTRLRDPRVTTPRADSNEQFWLIPRQ